MLCEHFRNQSILLKSREAIPSRITLHQKARKWDRNLPSSAIQFIAIIYNEYGLGNLTVDEQKNDDAEYLKNNGHPNYSNLVKNALTIKELPGLIQKDTKY